MAHNRHIDESVFASFLVRNLTVSKRTRITTAPFICIRCVYSYAHDTGVGIVSGYLFSGFVRTSYQISEISSTLSFCMLIYTAQELIRSIHCRTMKYLTLCLTAIALLFTVGCSRVATEVNDLDGGDGETTESSDAISVNPASATIPAKGETFSTTVSSAADWILTGGEEVSWCEPSQESGSNGDVVTFTVKPNTMTAERDVTYTFWCGDESAELTITQSAPAGQDDSDPYTIYYTTYHLQPVQFNSAADFGANLISNTYTDGVGKMVFDGPVKYLDMAFSGCTSLTSITIPNSVISIGMAFYGCTNLTSITIPDSVIVLITTFYGCTSLTNITIPNSVTHIFTATFYGCSSLTSITIPDSVTYIDNTAFCGCSSLTNITIPDSVTEIGEYAFSDCSSLTSLTIPGSVTRIGSRVFSNCSKLTKIYCKATTPPEFIPSLNAPTLGVNYSCTIYVPKASESDYINSEWGQHRIVGYDFN